MADKTGSKETIIPVPHRKSYFGTDIPEDSDDCQQVRRWTLGWPREAIASLRHESHSTDDVAGFGLVVVFHSDGKGEIEVTVTLKRPALRRS